MTTPNEELITYLRSFFIDENVSAIKANQIANALQSQAERIATLEDDVESLQKNIDTTCSSAAELIAKCFADRDTLRAELAEIEKTEPVATINNLSNSRMFTLEANGYSRKDKLYTRPMPAQRLTELKLLLLTTAYEQGVGKGIQRRDCNPYAADTDEHAVWKLGYEEGLGLRRI